MLHCRLQNSVKKKSMTLIMIALFSCSSPQLSHANQQNGTVSIEHPNSIAQSFPREQSVPNFVYRTTPTQPNLLFLTGFERTIDGFNGRHQRTDDLSEHLYSGFLFPELSFEELSAAQRQNPSRFISTTSDWEISYQNAVNFLSSYHAYPDSPYFHRDFYLYEIVPQQNFISVADTYERALRQEISNPNAERFENLRLLDSFYHAEHEYAALGSISARAIVSATRFYYDSQSNGYVQGETIQNNHYNPALTATLHPNNYPIGAIPHAQDVNPMFNYMGCEVSLNPQNRAASFRKKREDQNTRCPSLSVLNRNQIEMPKTLFEKNALEIQVSKINGKKYCLVPYKNYLYIDDCDITYENNKWLYTEFGQLIAEIDDDKNKQYYCLAAPNSDDSKNYLKMQICDLTKLEQHWTFNKLNDSTVTLLARSGKNVGVYGNSYAYLDVNSPAGKVTNQTLNVLNLEEIKKRTSSPLIQFEVSAILSEKVNNRYVGFVDSLFPYKLYSSIVFSARKPEYKSLTIYPGSYWRAYSDRSFDVEKYRNYYNAHNHAFFSNDGDTNGKPQVCYYSSLIEAEGSSWGKVKYDYCSTQEKLEKKYQWFFQKSKRGNKYQIVDFGKNVLRNNGEDSYSYTANTDWTDESYFLQNFSLNKEASKFAESYSSLESFEEKMGVQDKKKKSLFAFGYLYDSFSKDHKISN